MGAARLGLATLSTCGRLGRARRGAPARVWRGDGEGNIGTHRAPVLGRKKIHHVAQQVNGRKKRAMIATPEQRWQALLATFTAVTDAKGKPIDPGILEWGTGAPWIDIRAPGIQEEDRQAGLALTDARRQRDLQQLPLEEIAKRMSAALELKKRVELKHLAERSKAMSYLTIFYQNRHVPYDRLLIAHGAVGQTRLESQGAGLLPLLTLEQRRQKLAEYQEEMHAFACFLKAAFFA